MADVYEGFLPARLIRRDYYALNETETALVGRREGRVIRLGDPVVVRVGNVELARGRVDLEPAERAVETPGPARKRPKPKRPRETRRKAQGTRDVRRRPRR